MRAASVRVSPVVRPPSRGAGSLAAALAAGELSPFGEDAGRAYTRAVWDQWISTGWRPKQILTPAEIAMREARWQRNRRELIYQNQLRADQLRSRMAKRKAEALLLSCLTEEQKAEWRSKQRIDVISASGVRFRLQRGMTGNVVVLDAGLKHRDYLEGLPAGTSLCFHVEADDQGFELPYEDNVLAQKLMLESAVGEERFLAMANVHRWPVEETTNGL